VLENYGPGTMEKLGCGYEALAARNPRLIYLALKGYLAGPYAHRPALDEVVQFHVGLAHMTGPYGRPLRAGASLNDVMGGMFGAIGVLSAIVERQRTGCGQRIVSSLYENTVFLMGQHMAMHAMTGKKLNPMSVRTPAWGVYDIFPTADGEQIFIGIVTDTQWEAACRAFGMEELFADAAFRTNNDRVRARERLIPALEARFGKHAPLFVAFAIDGKAEKEVSMAGYKANPKALEAQLDKAAKGAMKPSLETFAKKYGELVQELEGVLRSHIAKVFTNFELAATVSKLRSIQVYVVGQARQPGQDCHLPSQVKNEVRT
jgi:hypothetical protein